MANETRYIMYAHDDWLLVISNNSKPNEIKCYIVEMCPFWLHKNTKDEQNWKLLAQLIRDNSFTGAKQIFGFLPKDFENLNWHPLFL